MILRRVLAARWGIGLLFTCLVFVGSQSNGLGGAIPESENRVQAFDLTAGRVAFSDPDSFVGGSHIGHSQVVNSSSADMITVEVAEKALLQQIAVHESVDRFPRSNDARDALFPFDPDTSDLSPGNLQLIESRAVSGSDMALGAFLIMGAHLPDYRERSHNLLVMNAARGSVLALTTLAERAAGGYGFDRPDNEASIFFEFLAWSTGRWSGIDSPNEFSPSLAVLWSVAECELAVKRALPVVAQHEAFSGRLIEDSVRCFDPRALPSTRASS